MQEGDSISSKDEVLFVNASINRIVDVMAILNYDMTPVDINHIAKRLGLKPRTLTNTLPFMETISLIIHHNNDKYSLTKYGANFLDVVRDKNVNDIINFCNDMFTRYPIFEYVRKSLIKNPNITFEEMGDLIGKEYNMEWSNNTKVTIGRSYISIVSFFITGKPMNKKRSNISNFYTKSVNIIIPRLTINQILYLIDEFNFDHQYHLINYYKEKTNDKQRSLKTLVELNIAENIDNMYSLTEIGLSIRKANSHDKYKLFRDVLMKNPFINDTYEFLKGNEDKLSGHYIGELYSKIVDADWETKTKDEYGNRILHWFIGVGLIKTFGNNKYKLSCHINEYNVPKKENGEIDLKLINEFIPIFHNFLFTEENWDNDFNIKKQLLNDINQFRKKNDNSIDREFDLLIDILIDQIDFAYEHSNKDIVCKVLQKLWSQYK